MSDQQIATPNVSAHALGPRDLTAADFAALASFRHALRQFLAFSDAAAGAAGVTAQQYQAMLAIKARHASTMSIKDLADELMLQHHGAVQLANRLEAAGLARRRPSATDRRAVHLELTPAGDDLLNALAANHMDELLKHRTLLAETMRQLNAITL